MGNKLSYPEVDLSGKVAVVTGGNTGIGYETAKALARLGAHTFIACRSKERAEAAIDRMMAELGGGGGKKEESGTDKETASATEPAEGKNKDGEAPAGDEGAAEPPEAATSSKEAGASEVQAKPKKEIKLEYLPLDLSSFQSTTDFVRAFKEKNLPLHILINNAAVAGVPYTLSNDGIELNVQVNHLGPMLLTLELLPLVLDTAASTGDGRIIFVSSSGHTMAAPYNVSLLTPTEDQYARLKAYSNSKLFNVMTSAALQRRLPEKNITVSSLHPGYVNTELVRNFDDRKFLMFLHKIAVNVIGKTPAPGAATTLNCAVNPDLNSQQHFYYDGCRPKQSSADSRNERFQEELWRKSFEMIKDHLSPDTIEKYGPKDDSPPEEGNAAPSGETVATPSGEKETTPSGEPITNGEKPVASGETA